MPSLTSIHYPLDEIVKASSEILLSKIANPDLAEIKKISLKAKLIIRDSATICSL